MGLQQSNTMRAFAVAAFFTTVLAAPEAQVPFTAFASGPIHAAPVAHAVHAAPVAHHAVHHAAPVAHHAVLHAAPVVHHAAHHHAPVHHAVHHAPHYAYEAPKHNCSVVDVVESAEVCTPAFATECADVELPIKKIIDVEMCYPVTATVCTESTQVIDNEICVYEYAQKTEETNAKTVEVSFNKECNVQMVTVCQPTPGYGYHSYGHNYCKEVAQETCYNVPVVPPVEPAVTVAYPEPKKVCVNKPIDLPIITCEDIVSETCITVPEVEEGVAVVEKCVTVIAAPACSTVELTLPKQVCKEINYGVELETHDVEPYVPETPAPYHA